ncbi:MAG: (d)CMP kinase, partial [Actinobacteria bacterium]|nr:(d)CMP kinase [Actinomycetota bacterium]
MAIVGPTASGKSALALRIAATLDAEIVNADAFCLYRGMDIGTAKPTLADRRAVPHHLVDTRDVQDAVDVVDYRAEARAAIEAIQKRGRTALLVGGSGLYVQAVLDDLRFPPTDPQVR